MGKKYLPIIVKNASGRVALDEILYLKQDLRNVKIVTDRGTITLRGKIGSLYKKCQRNFFQCHSYLIVNLTKIEEMSNNAIHFEGGVTICIGRNNFFKTRKVYNEYLEKI